MKQKIFIFLTAGFLAIGFFAGQEVKAGVSDNVWGWAWSENIGWIEFNNCTDPSSPATCGPINYGVKIGLSTGVFSGYAWSRGTDADVGGIGWIRFDPPASDGYPAIGPNYSACLDLPGAGQVCDGVDYTVSGWARACAVFPEGSCSGALRPDSERGGWDGWIRLRGTWANPVSLDPAPTPKQFHGWAWAGGDNNNEAVVGWISFNCAEGGNGGANICATKSNYKVMTSLVSNVVPTISNLQATQTNGCGGVIERFIWDYSGNPQSAYWLKAFDGVTETSSNWVTSSDHQGDLLLDYSKAYTWQLKVRDNIGTESVWTDGPNFNTSELYPSPNFTWIALGGNKIRFTNTTTDCSPSCSYSWTFQNGSPASSNLETPPDVIFTSAGNVTLIANAGGGRVCQIIKNISSFLLPPSWIEIPPF